MGGRVETSHVLPQCAVDYVEGVARAAGSRPSVRAEVRRELLDHFEDGLLGLEDSEERARRAGELIDSFGDSRTLAALIRRGKKRCREGCSMNLSGLLGLCLLGFAVILAAVLGPSPYMFVSVLTLAICLWIAGALGAMSYGIRDSLHGVWALRVLLLRIPSEDLSERDTTVLKGLATHVYSGAAIAFLMGLIQLLWTLDDLSVLAVGLAVCLLSPLYGALISEGIVRPALRVIETTRSGDGTAEASQERHEVEADLA